MTSKLLRPVDIAWLAAFRFLYGIALSIAMLRFVAYGWIDRLFVEPTFFFKYWGFEWVEALPGPELHLLFWALAGLALSMAVGFAFRIASFAFALGLTYFQLIDVSTYLNHYYLAALLAWMLAFSPANRAFSIDAWIKKRLSRQAESEPRQDVATGWLYLFRFQVGAVYTFAGLAKAQGDWLLHGQPLRIWLGAKTGLPILGKLFTIDAVPLLMSWAGFLFDSTVVAFLLYRKTRPYAYLVVIVFHVLTRLLLPIGMFPVMMVVSALVFFTPSWPRHALDWLKTAYSRIARKPIKAVAAFNRGSAPQASLSWMHRVGIAAGVLYCVVQLAMPLRFIIYGGNVMWHEQGMRYAWRVMLRAKGGQTTFLVRNVETGRLYHVSPRDYLTGLQEAEMSSQPDLILQLAHHIKGNFERRGLGPVEVRVDSRVALNGRRSVPFIDPEVNLAEVRDGIGRLDWVLPAPSGPPARTRPVL